MYRQVLKVNILNLSRNLRRTFLSDSYKCTDVWNARLTTPVIKNVNLDTFYIELEQKFSQQGKVSAIDIDIFVNSVKDDNHIEEVGELIHKIRMTDEASNTLDSTGHAVIRNHLDHLKIEELLHLLDNRLSYGLFLDSYTANLMFDIILKSKDFTSAAKVSSLLMLQDDFKNPITVAFSLYSCYNYLKNPVPFEKEEPIVETNPPAKKEEKKVRVKFLRNEFFDDHFDLRKSEHLVGKTLVTLGRYLKEDTPLKTSSTLYGLCLYEKFDEATQFLDDIQKNGRELIAEVIDKIKECTTKNEKGQSFLAKLQSIEGTLKKNSETLEQFTEKLLKAAVKNQENTDIETQKKIYDGWNELRVKKLEEELHRLMKVQRIKEIETISKELEDEERKLWFFENEDKLDLEIENKKVYYPKRWFGKKKKPRVIDEGYIPPEIIKNRN